MLRQKSRHPEWMKLRARLRPSHLLIPHAPADLASHLTPRYRMVWTRLRIPRPIAVVYGHFAACPLDEPTALECINHF